MDSDQILVLDSGKVVEYDSPLNLIQKEKGIFRSMVQGMGTFGDGILSILKEMHPTELLTTLTTTIPTTEAITVTTSSQSVKVPPNSRNVWKTSTSPYTSPSKFYNYMNGGKLWWE